MNSRENQTGTRPTASAGVLQTHVKLNTTLGANPGEVGGQLSDDDEATNLLRTTDT